MANPQPEFLTSQGIVPLPEEMSPLLNHPLIAPLPPAQSSVIDSDKHLLVISPDGSQAFAVPKDGGPVRKISLNQDLDAALQAARNRGDIPSAERTLRSYFDGAAVSPKAAGSHKTTGSQKNAGPAAAAAILDYAQRPQVKFGSESFPIIVRPDEGVDISKLWVKAHSQSKATLITAYEFDDMDMAASLVERSKAGEKIEFVGDYSHWFPERMPKKSTDLDIKSGPTAAIKFLMDNRNPNLEIHILKGLTDIGINHCKFTIFSRQGEELGQSGSFNYTEASQIHHWENVVFFDDQERISYLKSYFEWLKRRARPYSPDLEPEDPTFDPADPIPTPPPSKETALHGVPIPKASFSPNGEIEERLVQAEGLVKETLDILMFAPFPTPKMVAGILNLLGKDLPVRLISDAGQFRNAAHVLLPLAQKGLQLKTIKGPDVVIRHEPDNLYTKQHEKVMLFDAGQEGGLAKGGDSLNISNNALHHNFEITQFWTGFIAQFLQAHFNALWEIAQEVDMGTLVTMAKENLLALYKSQTTEPSPEPATP